MLQITFFFVLPAAAAAGGVNQPRWQQRGWCADTGHAIFRVACWGRVCAPPAEKSSYFESDPLIQAATLQLLGTMTEDDGFCCRGGICQTQRWEKGV